jgi:hypothetical protein
MSMGWMTTEGWMEKETDGARKTQYPRAALGLPLQRQSENPAGRDRRARPLVPTGVKDRRKVICYTLYVRR